MKLHAQETSDWSREICGCLPRELAIAVPMSSIVTGFHNGLSFVQVTLVHSACAYPGCDSFRKKKVFSSAAETPLVNIVV